MQNLYIYYDGTGFEKYFTAPNNEAAVNFLKENDIIHNDWNSSFCIDIQIKASGSYWIGLNLGRFINFKDNLF